MQWIERKTTVFKLEDLPFDQEKVVPINPTGLVIRISDYSMTVDLGVLCFSKRRRKARATANPDYETWLVVKSSECIGRRQMVLVLAEILYVKHRMGSRFESIDGFRSKFTQFIQWCDANYTSAFAEPKLMVSAFDSYTN